MPPVDGSSIGDRLGRFLSAMSAAPGAIELVRPTSGFLAELGKLVPGKLCELFPLLVMQRCLLGVGQLGAGCALRSWCVSSELLIPFSC